MRDRTWVGDGSRTRGADMIGRIWEPLLAQSTGPARDAACRPPWPRSSTGRGADRDGTEVLAQFHALASRVA